MNFHAVHATMQESECGDYQISRGPGSSGKFIYRAWHRPTNGLLKQVEVWDEAGDRAAAIGDCKLACAQHKGRA